jgi:ABC-2 type transport system ATP-binding protein
MLLEVEKATKRFRSGAAKAALDEVSFAIDEGEVVGLAGPNGAGKTTALRLLMGFIAPDRGRVRVFGRDAGERLHLGAVGWMPERPSFPPWTARDVLRFQAATFPSWDPALAEELVERLSLDASARATRLSRGQMGRLALVLALAHRPRLLLLDDPCLGLDPSARRLLLGELLGAATDEGCGILLSTHLLDEVAPALDRLVMLEEGRVVLDETIDAIRAREGAATLEDTFVAMTATGGRR